MVLLLVFMQLTRDLFAIAKFLLSYGADIESQTDAQIYAANRFTSPSVIGVGKYTCA